MEKNEKINGEVISGFMTRQEASKFLGVSTRTIDRYIAQSKISVTRKEGHVLLREDELYTLLQEKNPVAAQVVRSQKTEVSEIQPFNEEVYAEVEKYKVLYQEAKDDVEQRDELIRTMHYRLGVLETESKGKVPLLEAQASTQELNHNISVLSEEKEDLRSKLVQTRKGRTVFFVVSLLLLFLLFVFVFLQFYLTTQ